MSCQKMPLPVHEASELLLPSNSLLISRPKYVCPFKRNHDRFGSAILLILPVCPTHRDHATCDIVGKGRTYALASVVNDANGLTRLLHRASYRLCRVLDDGDDRERGAGGGVCDAPWPCFWCITTFLAYVIIPEL